MQSRLLLIDLYDIYKDLLTEKQSKYFEAYYFENLSLAEISENDNISRNAIHKHIMDATLKLEYYENKLKIKEKNNKLDQFSNKLNKELSKELKEII